MRIEKYFTFAYDLYDPFCKYIEKKVLLNKSYYKRKKNVENKYRSRSTIFAYF
jgi:hypothetical protein